MLYYCIEPATRSFQQTMFPWVCEVVPPERHHRSAKAVQQACSCADESDTQPVLVTRANIASCLDEIEPNTGCQAEHKCLCRTAYAPNQNNDSQRLDCLFNQRSHNGYY